MRFVGGPPFVHQDCNLQLSNLATPVHPEVPRHREALPVRAPPLRSATTAVNGTLRLQLPELRLHLPKLRLRLHLAKLPDELHSKRRPSTRPAYHTDLDVAMSIHAIGTNRLRQQSPKNRRLPQTLPIRCYCSLLSEDQRNKKHTESRGRARTRKLRIRTQKLRKQKRMCARVLMRLRACVCVCVCGRTRVCVCLRVFILIMISN